MLSKELEKKVYNHFEEREYDSLDIADFIDLYIEPFAEILVEELDEGISDFKDQCEKTKPCSELYIALYASIQTMEKLKALLTGGK